MKKTSLLKIAILVLGTASFLCGFDFITKTVRLKSEEPLISLQELIVDSKPGNGGKKEQGLPDPGPMAVEMKETESAAKEEPAETESGTEALRVDITVTVTDESVRVDDAPVSDAKELAKEMEKVYRDGMTVYLVDDYAEYSTYQEVKNALEALSVSPVEKRK